MKCKHCGKAMVKKVDKFDGMVTWECPTLEGDLMADLKNVFGVPK